MNNRQTKSKRLLRWIFRRSDQVITCEIDANGKQGYEVCVVPHWNVSASVIERFDAGYQAFERHAEVARHLREAGWVALRSAAVVLFALTAVGCATMNVSSHVERGVDFAQYRTFDWGPADALPTGDPRLDKNPFFQDHVQGAVEKQLDARGLARPTSGTPDLLIHYHANISQRLDVNRLDRERGYCHDDDCQVRVVEFEAGTLVLDIVDARTNRLVWRGWAQHGVTDMLDNPDRMEERINEAVTRMLERLPRAVLVTSVPTGGR